MPSATRGSILISTANDIGEALVEKLGGVGYSPNEWKEKYNLCGIAPVDSAPALSVLADSAGTGDERGSILIATADAIGAILNKKYNVLRGFKPKEWASACRKMKALEEGSVASASIASFSDGADTVPLTSCVCNIDANLDGKTAVNAVHARKNLLDTAIAETKMNNSVSITCDGNGKYTATGTATGGSANITFTLKTPCTIKSGMFLHLMNSGASGSVSITLQKQDNTSIYAPALSSANRIADLSSYVGEIIYSIRFYVANGNSFEMSLTPMLCFSNATTTFEPYQTPETKTADLGRAVYGGSADIIKGEGVDNCTNRNLVGEGFTWTYNTTELSFPYFTIGSNAPNKAANKNFVCDGYVNRGNYRSFLQDGEIGVFNNTTGINRFCVRDDSCTTLEQFLEKNANTKITYEVTNPTDFTFEPVKIDSFPGANNIWNDCGNTAVEYYQAPTPYARKTATGGIANFSDQRTDLPLTKAIANIAPSIAGKSAVNLVRTGASLANISDVSGNMTNSYFYNIGSDYVLTAGTTYKIAMEVNSTVTPFAVSVGVGDNAYRYDIYNTGINNKNGVVAFEFTVEASHLATWNKLWIRAPRYSAPSEPSTPTTCTFTVKNITLYSTATTYTAELGETVYGGNVDFVSGEVNKEYGMITFDGSSDESWLYSDAYGWFYIDNQFGEAYRNNSESDFMICNLGTQSSYAVVTSLPDLHFACTSGTNSRFAFKNSQYSTVEDFKTWLSNNNMIVVYKLATPTESAIPGRVISPIEGVNNYWNDAGGDTEIQYFESEAQTEESEVNI